MILSEKERSARKILFVCLGNICRSPMAETIMVDLINKKGLAANYTIDSAGILDYHEGEKADYRMRCHANFRGYEITHLSRPVQLSDFDNFDLIFGMDDQNHRDLSNIAQTDEQRQKIKKLIDFCAEFNRPTIPDPYYGGDSGFKLVIDMLETACGNLLQELESK